MRITSELSAQRQKDEETSLLDIDPTLGHNLLLMNRLIGPTPAEVSVYQGYLTDWSNGAAYRDWWVEYPPGLLWLAKTPTLFTQNPELYFATWLIMIVVCAVITHGILGKKAIWITAMALAGGLLTTHRFDIFVVFIVAWALEANRRNHTFVASFLLTLGAFTKVYPAIPLVLLFLFRERKHWLSMTIGTLIVAIPTILWWAPGIKRFVEFHGQKHVQIESAAAPAKHGKVIYEKFSYVFEDTNPDRVSQANYVGFGLLAIALFRIGSRKNYEIASYIGVLTFMLTGNIFSPQYMLWLASFLPWMPGYLGLATIGLTWLTNFYFVNYYDAIIEQLKPETHLVAIRNLLLVLMEGFVTGIAAGSAYRAIQSIHRSRSKA